jgi:hypothetical protein
MKSILMHNPGLAISLALLLAGGLVSLLMAAVMARSGVSLKGIAFFAIFFAIVVLPQVVGHLALAQRPPGATVAVVPGAAGDAAPAAAGRRSFSLAAEGDSVAAPEQVFGPQHAQARREDQRASFAGRMAGLRVADAVQWPGGDSVTALLFDSADQASAALMAYLSLYQVAPTLDRGGVELHGQRGLGGGYVQLRRSGNALLVVTALDTDALQARVATLPLLQGDAAPAGIAASATTAATAGASAATAGAAQPLVPALQPLVQVFRSQVLLQVGGVLALVALAAWWFFAGTAWAGRVSPAAGVAPLPAPVLRQRLLAVNQADVPVTVEARPDGRMAVTWRRADARWLDLAGAHRLQRTHRLLLRLDDTTRRVHVTEQSTELDASVGLSGASLRWRTELGLVFFQVDHRRIVGLQFGPDGRPTGDLSYAWRFNLHQLKAPFIAAVTAAGWDWQPVVLDLPALLDRGTPSAAR